MHLGSQPYKKQKASPRYHQAARGATPADGGDARHQLPLKRGGLALLLPVRNKVCPAAEALDTELIERATHTALSGQPFKGPQDGRNALAALRALLVDAGITRTSGQHDGQTYVIRIKETQSRRTPPVRDMAQELLNALIAPFDEVVLAGNDHPSAAAGLGPGVPVSFDDACNHIVCRAVSGLKERFIKYNTTLSVTKATAGESTGEAVPHPLRQHIQDRLSRHLRYKKIAAEMAAPLQERVKVAKSRQTAQLPTVEQLIDDHAPETWSLKVPTRLPSPEPVRVPSPPRRPPASRDEQAMPPPPVRPPRSATRSTSMEALRPRNLSDAPVDRTESRTENRARSATTWTTIWTR